MKPRVPMQRWMLLFVLLPILSLGCDPEELAPQKPAERGVDTITPNQAFRKTSTSPSEEKDEAKPKVARIGKNIFLETAGDRRRVIIAAEVVLREGPLELLLTRMTKKEHESILAADIDGRLLNAALLATKAKPGAPVKFEPNYKAASGPVIKVTLEYRDEKGKLVRVKGQDWIRDQRTKKTLKADWVYGGSQLIRNPLDPKKPLFLAHHDGDLVCISNFEGALLDLPVKISKANEDLFYEANTALIPKEKTKVTVILEPVLKKKEK